jgi:hypothetical protein
MSMSWKSVTIIAAVAVAMIGCSAAPVDLTEGAAKSKSRIAKLEKAFLEDLSQTDRIRVATELVRLGVGNPVYRTYIADEVDRALAAEDAAVDEWLRQQLNDTTPRQQTTVKLARLADRPAIVPQAIARDVAMDRPPDPTNLVPIVGASMTAVRGDVAMRDRLHRALDGHNVLLSAEAALGLAKIKDEESIPRIEAAAKRFEDGFLFASALVYYGNPTADAIAAKLLNDPEMLSEMQATARSRKYDPYYRR